MLSLRHFEKSSSWYGSIFMAQYEMLIRFKVAFCGEPLPIFCRPALSARRLWCNVVDGIADDVQIGVIVRHAWQILLGIPAVAEDYDAPLRGKTGHGLPTMDAASPSLDFSFLHMWYPRGTARYETWCPRHTGTQSMRLMKQCPFR